jgi:hypothetical protein
MIVEVTDQEIAWKKYCYKRGLLEDELEWQQRAQRNWKWVIRCKLVGRDL